MPVRLTAQQVANRLGRGAPFHPNKKKDGAIGTGAWSWDVDDVLAGKAAAFTNVAETKFLQLANSKAIARFKETGDLRLTRTDLRAGVTRADLRQFGRMDKDAQDAVRRWGSHRRQFERSIGLSRRGSRSRPMALGAVEGYGDLLKAIAEHEPDLMKDWKKEMGQIVSNKVVPEVKKIAPVSGGVSKYLGGRAKTKLTDAQAAARRAYVYPDNRAKPGQGSRVEKPGSLKKSVRPSIWGHL